MGKEKINERAAPVEVLGMLRLFSTLSYTFERRWVSDVKTLTNRAPVLGVY